MGSATSSSPTVSLSGIYQRMQCLVACYGSEVHIELRDVIDNHEKENAKVEEEENVDPFWFSPLLKDSLEVH